MEQPEINKIKYTLPHKSIRSTKPPVDVRVPLDAYWKYTQRNNQDVNDKNSRRSHPNSMTEPTASYYSSTNSYKTPKSHHLYPIHPKYLSALHTKTLQQYQEATMKTGRSKDYSVTNKDRCKTEQEEDNNVGYTDEELGNFTEDNLENDVEEREENNRDRISECLDKEYDEQEVDDEIDEESDAPAETHMMQEQSAAKKDALLRAQQRLRAINQQDPHRIRYSQHSPQLYQARPLATRYYSNIPDHDIYEVLSDEDLYTVQASKNPPRRSSTRYPQNWIPQRSSNDRYNTTISPTQLNRRPRPRPEIKSFIEAEFVDRRKCSRCGNISIRKLPPLQTNKYKFQDSPIFPAKEYFGNDAEILDQPLCGYCKPKHHVVENTRHLTCEIPSSVPHSMKLRRSRDATNTPIRETLEGKHAMNELSHEYARIPSKCTKDTLNSSRDRIRHSTRTSARYDL
ncbi:uncharacterized protein LOC109858148 isoform X2 [Pseudomyrmex gracilis]|uniref:uncharacterized protein LOC109858148 isoform X2 n=1 Tax=Pseudomyrmex gracilis TaxID=219809 RepID=UPI000995D450|nr:uncharacterized protein LOC109858148 isoform X2 [Pseudomyrmex gracilis]